GLFAARGGYTDKDSLFILLTARVVAPSAKPNGSTGTSSGLKKASDPAVLLSDGKILFQQGKMDEAERKLQEVLVREPNNQAALYYLSLIKQARAQVDQNIPSLARNVPGPEGAPANERSESPRQKISQKLNDITFDKVSYANSTLVEVIRNLTEQATRWDPDREGINFLLNRNQFGPDFDPRTGQPRSPASDVDLTSVKVNVDRRNVRLVDVLDAIVKSADHPIKYSIFDYGVEFSFHDTNAVELHTRTFRVDMEKFFEKYPVVASPYGTNSETTAIQITVIKFFNDVGVNLAAPKSVFFNDRQGTLTVRATDEDLERIQSALDAGKLSLPRVFAGADAAGFSAFTRTFKVDVNTFFLELEKRGVISPQTNAIVSTAATPSGQRSIRGIVTDSDQSTFRVNVQNGLLTYFRGQGVDLQAPKSIFYNDRQSTLTIRATKEDLDTIEQLLNVLNTPTPQVTVKARFVEVDEELLKTLLASGFAASTNRTQDRILTEEQLRPILRGLNLIHEGEVTTLSGRQANFQVVDVQDVLFFGTNKTAMLPIKTNAMPFGTFLDVIPVVAVDGYAIQLKVIPSVTEFLGYQAYAANTTPMAKIRRRTTTMDAIIQDGSTLMVGDLGDEWVVTKPDGTVARHPFDADHGKPMVVFVTATIIDAAGNRVHGDNANAGTKSMPARTISYETK
ncbi:MAG TPA: hypothetical protein VHC44_02765, partial [Verrucomicrobiae bacterium]|nr:hypothetical protein [Verrucomicrobiae bacterium]